MRGPAGCAVQLRPGCAVPLEPGCAGSWAGQEPGCVVWRGARAGRVRGPALVNHHHLLLLCDLHASPSPSLPLSHTHAHTHPSTPWMTPDRLSPQAPFCSPCGSKRAESLDQHPSSRWQGHFWKSLHGTQNYCFLRHGDKTNSCLIICMPVVKN